MDHSKPSKPSIKIINEFSLKLRMNGTNLGVIRKEKSLVQEIYSLMKKFQLVWTFSREKKNKT
jgi:hypothetical protein